MNFLSQQEPIQVNLKNQEPHQGAMMTMTTMITVRTIMLTAAMIMMMAVLITLTTIMIMRTTLIIMILRRY